MIKNSKFLRKFEMDFIRKNKLNYKQNMAIFEAMYEEANLVLKHKARNPTEGLETIIKIAKAINSV